MHGNRLSFFWYGDFDNFIEAEMNFLPKEVLTCAEENKNEINTFCGLIQF